VQCQQLLFEDVKLCWDNVLGCDATWHYTLDSSELMPEDVREI
jgi:hypothetical protein